MIAKDLLRHLDVPVKARPVERRRAVRAREHVDGPAGAEEGAHGTRVVELSGECDAAAFLFTQTRDQSRIVSHERVDRLVVAELAGSRETERHGRARHEEIEHVRVAELVRDQVRSLERTKRPLIDRSARTWILHRKVRAIYRRVDARRIGVEVGANTLEITERGAHQDVGATAVSYTHLRAHETPEHLV